MTANEFLNKTDANWRPAWERLMKKFGDDVVIAAWEAADEWSRNCPAHYRIMEYESRERAKAFDGVINEKFPGCGFSYANFSEDWGAG